MSFILLIAIGAFIYFLFKKVLPHYNISTRDIVITIAILIGGIYGVRFLTTTDIFSGWSEPDQPAKEFCEDFFIANQKSTWSNQIKMLSGVIRKVRMAGHAPTLSDVSQEVRDDLDERRRNWTTSEDMAEYINEKLGTNLEKDDVNYFMFLYFSSQGLQNPILKYKYKESVDDAEVWIVEDYYTMKKTYLTINGTNYHIQVQGKVNDPND